MKADNVEVDGVHDEIFVPQDRQILVFSRTANGDVAPIRVLGGTDTGLSDGVPSVDPINNLLVVPSRDRILIFNRTDAGNVKPKAVIASAKLRVGNVRVYPPKGLIVARAKGVASDDAIAVWSIHDKGDVPPLLTLTEPKGPVLGGELALNPKAKEIIVGGVVTIRKYYLPEIF